MLSIEEKKRDVIGERTVFMQNVFTAEKRKPLLFEVVCPQNRWFLRGFYGGAQAMWG